MSKNISYHNLAVYNNVTQSPNVKNNVNQSTNLKYKNVNIK